MVPRKPSGVIDVTGTLVSDHQDEMQDMLGEEEWLSSSPSTDDRPGVDARESSDGLARIEGKGSARSS